MGGVLDSVPPRAYGAGGAPARRPPRKGALVPTTTSLTRLPDSSTGLEWRPTAVIPFGVLARWTPPEQVAQATAAVIDSFIGDTDGALSYLAGKAVEAVCLGQRAAAGAALDMIATILSIDWVEPSGKGVGK